MKATNKARNILERMKRRQLFRAQEMRDRVLDQFNRDNMDDVGPVGTPDQQSQVLTEMNNLQAEAEEIYRNVGAGLKTI